MAIMIPCLQIRLKKNKRSWKAQKRPNISISRHLYMNSSESFHLNKDAISYDQISDPTKNISTSASKATGACSKMSKANVRASTDCVRSRASTVFKPEHEEHQINGVPHHTLSPLTKADAVSLSHWVRPLVVVTWDKVVCRIFLFHIYCWTQRWARMPKISECTCMMYLFPEGNIHLGGGSIPNTSWSGSKPFRPRFNPPSKHMLRGSMRSTGMHRLQRWNDYWFQC